MSKQLKPSNVESPFIAIKDVAHYFCVSQTAIRVARGIFAKLRRTVTNSRTTVQYKTLTVASSRIIESRPH
jgi:hypothetical protein